MITLDRRDGRSPSSRAAVFALIVTVHGVVVFVALHWATRMHVRRDESLVFLVIPKATSVLAPEPPAADLPRKKIQPQAITLPQISTKTETPEPPKQAEHPAIIDWAAEAERQAKQQIQLSMGTHPRALDKHAQGLDLNGGLGPDKAKGPQFGWYNARLHRFESVPGGGMVIHLNDRCVVVLVPFPFPFCGIGKIPTRGDLLDHMHDEPQEGGNAANAIP